MKCKRDREEACFICGHYHDYEGGEPCSICGHVASTSARHMQDGIMPTSIISSFLYLGSYDTASRAELLKELNISHILNTVPACQALYRNTFTYHTLSQVPPDFQECFDFLDSVHENGGKVLVYCMSGLSRSPSVVIAYLMRHKNWNLAESFKWVKSKRPAINLAAGDFERLMEFDRSLYGSCSVPGGLEALNAADFVVGGPFSFPSCPSSNGGIPAAGPPLNPFPHATHISPMANSGPFVFGACNGATSTHTQDTMEH